MVKQQSFGARSRLTLDVILSVIIAVLAVIVTATSLRASLQTGKYYQESFSPAVMWAAGHGLARPLNDADVPGLTAFLSGQSQDMPWPDRSVAVSPVEDHFAAVHRYLFQGVGLCWRVSGISWDSLWLLFATLLSLTACGCYWLSRAFAGPALSLAAALAFVLNGSVQSNLPHLRDFSKAPFIVISLAIMAHAVSRILSPRALFLHAAALGAVMGAGMGFRMDLMSMCPLAVMGACVFPSVRGACFGWRRPLPMRMFAFMAMAIAFLVTGAPVLSALGRGSNSLHVIILGLMEPFDGALGVIPAETHELGFRYNDSYVAGIINDYGARHLGFEASQYASPPYDRAGLRYYLDVARVFPADLAVRALAAALRIASVGIRPDLAWLALCAVPAAVIMSVAGRLRAGLFFLFALGFIGAVASLQYALRHNFHLVVIPLFSLAFCAQLVVDELQRRGALAWLPAPCGALLFRSARPRRLLSRSSVRSLVILVGILGVVGFMLIALRSYQSASVARLQAQFAALSCRQGAFSVRPMDSQSDVVGLHPDLLRPSSGTSPELLGRFWLLELSYDRAPDCDLENVRIDQACGRPGHYEDDSRTLFFDVTTVEPGHIAVRYVFFTTRSDQCREFHLVMDSGCLPTVKRFCELQGGDFFPFLVNMRLPVDGGSLVPYQRLGKKQDQRSGAGQRIMRHSFPSDWRVTGPVARRLTADVGLNPADLTLVDLATSVTPDRISYDTTPNTPYHYIVSLPARDVGGDEVLVVRGELRSGGVGVGFLRDSKWAGQLNVTKPGRFELFMRPPEGRCIPMLYHVTPEGKSSFTIDGFGWSSAQPTSGLALPPPGDADEP